MKKIIIFYFLFISYFSYALETKITFPLNNEIIRTQTFAIKGTSKTSSIKLFINDDSPFELETMQNEFSFEVLLSDGNHTVKIIDDEGTTDTILFNVNTELFINITDPISHSIVQNLFITVAGTTKPLVIVKINLDDVYIGTTISDELGNFSYNVPLTLGNHILEAIANTPESQVSMFIPFFVATNFFVTVDEPKSGTLIHTNPLRIQGRAKKGSKVSLFILKNHIASEFDFETEPIAIIDIDDQEQYSVEVILTDGFYTIKAIAIDLQSNFAEAKSAIQVDINQDDIVIDQEESGSIELVEAH